MAEGFLYQSLRPNGTGFLNDGWSIMAHTNIDDIVTNPTVSGTGDYIEATYDNLDDLEWQGYALDDITPAYWWNRIAKIEVNFLYFLHVDDVEFSIKQPAHYNVAWVESGVRKGWSPYELSSVIGKGHVFPVVEDTWTWANLTFYPNEQTFPFAKPNNPTDWNYIDWNRGNSNGIEIEVRSPEFHGPGDYYRIAVFYADLYVWPTVHGGA